MHSVTRLLNGFSLIQSFLHLRSQAATWPQCQYAGHRGALQSQASSPEIFILEAVSTGDKWEASSVFSIDGFPYLLWFG